MANINDRIGSQSVVRVLSNASSPPSNLIRLNDIDNTLKTEDGMILVWDLSSEKFIMTSVIDSSSTTIEGIAYFTNDTDSTNTTNGAIIVSGGVGIAKNLNVGLGLSITGIAVFESDVDINAAVNILNDLVVQDSIRIDDNLRVTGLSTFNSNVDINAALDVSSTSTFNATVNILNDLDVQDSVKIDDNLRVTGLSTFNSNVDINAALDVSSTSTFSDNVNILKDLVVQDSIRIDDNLRVTGLSTFNSNVDINAAVNILNDLNVQDSVSIDNDLVVSRDLFVSGITTLASSGGITTTGGDVYVGGDLYVADDLVIDEFNFRKGTIREDLNVLGLTTTRNLIVTGVSTFQNNVNVSGFVTVTEGLYYDENDYSGPNGIAYFDNDGKLVSTASTVGFITTSNYILTTETAGIGTPVWTTTIDGGEY